MQVLAGLHLDQPADGTLKLEREPLAPVERVWREVGGDEKLDLAIVELVDQGDEAARGVVKLSRQGRNVRNDDRREPAGQLDVVLLAARSVLLQGKVKLF